MQRGMKEREHYWFPLSPYYLHHLSVTTHIMVSFHTYHWLIQNITKWIFQIFKGFCRTQI